MKYIAPVLLGVVVLILITAQPWDADSPQASVEQDALNPFGDVLDEPSDGTAWPALADAPWECVCRAWSTMRCCFGDDEAPRYSNAVEHSAEVNKTRSENPELKTLELDVDPSLDKPPISAGEAVQPKRLDWEQDFDAAKHKAASEKKNVLLLFDASDAKESSFASGRFKEAVATRKEFRDRTDQEYVCVYIDNPQTPEGQNAVKNADRNRKLTEKFQITVFPTVGRP